MKLHKAWIMLVICCLSQGAAIGIAANCVGLFFVPAAADLGCSIASISFFVTLVSLTQCLTMTTLTNKVFAKFKTRHVMFVASILLCSRIFLALSTSLWQWFLLGIVSGVGISFLNGFCSSIILERWFIKKYPIAMSLMATFSGIFGIFISLITGKIISQSGWRFAMFISYLILFICEVPTLFVVLNPSENCLTPYGFDPNINTVQEEVKVKKEVRVPFNSTMIKVMVLSFINASLTAFISHLSSFGSSVSVPYDPSLIVTFYMVGNLLFKLLYGVLVEKIGLRKASILSLFISITGCVLLFTANSVLVLIGTFLFGASALIYTSMIPLTERHLYSSDEYPTVLKRSIATYTVSYASFSYLYGLVVDFFGSYSISLVFMISVTLVAIALASNLLKK